MVHTIDVNAITAKRVKKLSKTAKRFTILIFPLAWSRTIEWLKPNRKVVLTLNGESITVEPIAEEKLSENKPLLQPEKGRQKVKEV